MERMEKSKPHYSPWFASDDDAEESWPLYLHRSFGHVIGEELPFEDSEWTYKKPTTRFDDVHLSDETIHQQVLKNLYDSSKLDATHISVMVMNGNVHLSGKVDDEDEKAEAEKICRLLPDVWSVDNQLSVMM